MNQATGPGSVLGDTGRPALIGMVHLLPLPGSAGWGGDMTAITDAALRDAEALVQGGCDALLVENMGDVPYLRAHVGPETVAAMSVVTRRVVDLGLPTGVQVLAAANLEALGVAVAAGARFVRMEAFAYAHVADEGWLDASAGPVLRMRAQLGAPHVQVWADVQKKHAAHAVTADLSLGELAAGTVFCGADALIVTGLATGRPAAPDDVRAARTAGRPVVVGSGIEPDNVTSFVGVCDGLIVGSWLKEDGDWRRPVSVERVRKLRFAIDQAAQRAGG